MGDSLTHMSILSPCRFAALKLLEAELSIDWHYRTDGWFSLRTCRIAALTLSLLKKQNLTCPFSRNFAKLRHKKMRWFLLFIRISNAGKYKYFISLESLGGGQRDSMKNWIFKIPDFCLKPLSPVTYDRKKRYLLNRDSEQEMGFQWMNKSMCK